MTKKPEQGNGKDTKRTEHTAKPWSVWDEYDGKIHPPTAKNPYNIGDVVLFTDKHGHKREATIAQIINPTIVTLIPHGKYWADLSSGLYKAVNISRLRRRQKLSQ